MMKYKVGDKVRFMKDCALSDGSVIHDKSVWEVSYISGECYLLKCGENNLSAMIEQKLVDDNCEKINTAPSIAKRINNKHNILNGLLNSDGSVDGEKLMEKLSNQSNDSNAIRPDYYKFHGYDVFDIADYFNLSPSLTMALKYLLRCQYKENEMRDCSKAIRCIERHMEIMKGKARVHKE